MICACTRVYLNRRRSRCVVCEGAKRTAKQAMTRRLRTVCQRFQAARDARRVA